MNAKVERTKRAFQEAFCRLIQTTPAAQITVFELCREAGLNRSTFYRHYAIPLDVITDAVREILAQGDLPPQPMTRQTLYDFLLRSCTLWYQNKALFGVCLHCGGDLMLLLYRSLRLQEQIDRWELGSALDSFVFGGIIGVANQWFHSGFVQSPAEVAACLTGYVFRLHETTPRPAPEGTP